LSASTRTSAGPCRRGIEEGQLARLLSLESAPAPVEPGNAVLHDDFADAIRGYLAGHPREEPVGQADVALAILQAVEADSLRVPCPLGWTDCTPTSRLQADTPTASRALERATNA
jgi:hypothetical protein